MPLFWSGTWIDGLCQVPPQEDGRSPVIRAAPRSPSRISTKMMKSENKKAANAAASPKSNQVPHWERGIAAQNVPVSNRLADVFVAAAIVS